MPTYAPFARPIYVMLKPVGSKCNLACDYCYYLEKEYLYSQKNLVMSDELLERFTQQYIESQTMPQVLFTWHGGETLMRPISFYKRALELQKRYARGRQIDNSIQTNGTLLNDEWCAFFKENNFLVGISIDGPQEFHDEYRRDKMGRPSFYRVMKGIELLQKHGVEFNCMAVVNDYNVDYPLEFYRFFKDIGCQFVQFTPIVERIRKDPSSYQQVTDKKSVSREGYDGTQRGEHDNVRRSEVNNIRHEGLRLATAKESEEETDLAPFTVPARKWGKFLCAIFDEWVKQDVGKIFIQLFDSTLANWVGEQPGVCTLARQCGHAGVMEFNGDVYSCDHFVFPEYRLGNIYTQTLTSMMYSPEQQKFGNDKYDSLPQQCLECDMLFACHGECPKNRFIKDKYGNEGLNYLCEGYYRFFTHVAPYMDFMKKELLAKRPPANVMEWLKTKKQR
ncbi:MAG: anaerobic sulfatase maturase [Bacteroidota bacterium]|nr:anaerobic sulfatase maturase [Bacteroidota bacterium]